MNPPHSQWLLGNQGDGDQLGVLDKCDNEIPNMTMRSNRGEKSIQRFCHQFLRSLNLKRKVEYESLQKSFISLSL